MFVDIEWNIAEARTITSRDALPSSNLADRESTEPAAPRRPSSLIASWKKKSAP
jgi:hypothetical protein